jgi:predicted transglutaminase-like cysteine proteinase
VLLALAALLMAAWPSRAWDAARMVRAAAALGPAGEAAVRDLQVLLQSAGDGAEPAQLEAVNRYVNSRLSFREDAQAWGVPDHWASPLQALARGEGDCEDYALAKYFMLRSLGVPESRLRLVYVRALLPARPGGAAQVQAHMVLAAYPVAAVPAPPGGTEPLVLDNLRREILPASQRPDLTPVFSFNGEGLWEGAAGARAGDPMVRLNRWREVAAQAAAEGFVR